jgi:DNA repair exonuclease SbcCD nuclease subunit
VHRREILLEDPLAVFPGNTQGRHARETGAKGCVVVSVDDRGRAEASFRPLDAARWFVEEVDASEAAGGYDLIDAVTGRLEDLLEENPELPLVVRVRATGSSRAHEALASDPDRWTNEIRAAALEAGGGRVFLEKVQVRTRPPGDPAGSGGGGPVRELLRTLDELGSDPEALASLGRVLDDLQRKLPRELREAEDAPAPGDSDWVRDVLEQVRPMLVRRLMREGRSS